MRGLFLLFTIVIACRATSIHRETTPPAPKSDQHKGLSQVLNYLNPIRNPVNAIAGIGVAAAVVRKIRNGRDTNARPPVSVKDSGGKGKHRSTDGNLKKGKDGDHSTDGDTKTYSASEILIKQLGEPLRRELAGGGELRGLKNGQKLSRLDEWADHLETLQNDQDRIALSDYINGHISVLRKKKKLTADQQHRLNNIANRVGAHVQKLLREDVRYGLA